MTLTPALFADADTFYSATIQPGQTTLAPSLFANASTFYAASVSDGTIVVHVQYPLAGIPEAFELAGMANVYPITAAQTYPAPAPAARPLAGAFMTYPLRRAA